jgi:hypothetical protein
VRIIHSVSAVSIASPPASALAERIAASTSARRSPSPERRTGSTVTWNWRTWPPTEATSETPGTVCNAGFTTQSCARRSSLLSTESDTSPYWKIHPTPEASGPIFGDAPSGSTSPSEASISCTRERAQ